MKLLINTKIIEALNPCKNRFDNWKQHYEHKEMNVDEFLALDKITHKDKLWVVLRLAPRIVVETFAIHCIVTTHPDVAALLFMLLLPVLMLLLTLIMPLKLLVLLTLLLTLLTLLDYATRVTANHRIECLRQLEALEYLIRTHEENEK